MGLLPEGKDVKWLEEELEKEASRPRNKKQLEELWKRWIDLWGHDVTEDVSFRSVFLNSNALRNVLKAAFTTKDIPKQAFIELMFECLSIPHSTTCHVADEAFKLAPITARYAKMGGAESIVAEHVAKVLAESIDLLKHPTRGPGIIEDSSTPSEEHSYASKYHALPQNQAALPPGRKPSPHPNTHGARQPSAAPGPNATADFDSDIAGKPATDAAQSGEQVAGPFNNAPTSTINLTWDSLIAATREHRLTEKALSFHKVTAKAVEVSWKSHARTVRRLQQVVAENKLSSATQRQTLLEERVQLDKAVKAGNTAAESKEKTIRMELKFVKSRKEMLMQELARMDLHEQRLREGLGDVAKKKDELLQLRSRIDTEIWEKVDQCEKRDQLCMQEANNISQVLAFIKGVHKLAASSARKGVERNNNRIRYWCARLLDHSEAHLKTCADVVISKKQDIQVCAKSVQNHAMQSNTLGLPKAQSPEAARLRGLKREAQEVVQSAMKVQEDLIMMNRQMTLLFRDDHACREQAGRIYEALRRLERDRLDILAVGTLVEKRKGPKERKRKPVQALSNSDKNDEQAPDNSPPYHVDHSPPDCDDFPM